MVFTAFLINAAKVRRPLEFEMKLFTLKLDLSHVIIFSFIMIVCQWTHFMNPSLNHMWAYSVSPDTELQG